ncbi:MAG: carboxypeptidase regulatory-like domain-containing protein, partial [Bacteroidales bacterium]|nr:carboxypeptidase regulatory-like domain-containing protein [Bacteroidales bacterium]
MVKTNNKIVLLLLSGFFIVFEAWAQKGSIEGVVYDRSHNETLVGANVIIEGTTTGTITDFDGRFTLSNLNPGTYNVLVSFISYQPVILNNIKVEPNKSTVVKVELEEITTAI